ncbi:alpha/beta hydrolase [Marinobacterium sp. D7]|uniref:alpha/beta fold hydrolase n=1 Tax=Marinobacterium ramblicola TaxID=2849041 RepID=UPI001C2DA7D1|nr:alpha/beta hydrolase [Marinobacterium ramblicola]MBV1789819.1 alpha/beta hydrolase [Marinobacterium ramblicola]
MSGPVEYKPAQPAEPSTIPWVLLRGLAREQRHWGSFPQRLAEQLNTRVICPDTPGNGYRYRDTSPQDIHGTLESVRSELNETGPFNLLGLSMGGMIATEWASCYPQEVGVLVLINSSFANFSLPWQRLRPPALCKVLASLAMPTVKREGVIFDLICQRSGDRRETLAAWAGFAHECPLRRSNFGRQLYSAARYRAPSAAPLPNALILCGRGDRLVNPACSAAIARRWGITLDAHPWAGHDLTHDDPDWVLKRIACLQERAGITHS